MLPSLQPTRPIQPGQPPDPLPRRRPPARRRSSGLHPAAALCNADWHIAAPLLAALAATWHTDIASIATGVAAHSLGQGLALPLWGWSADRFGPARSLRAGLLLAAAANAACALCSGVESWVALRAAAGVGFAAVAPSVALSYDRLPTSRDRQRAFAGLTTVTAASAIAAPVVTGVAAHLGTWRSVFAVLALCTAATAARVRVEVPTTVYGRGTRSAPEPTHRPAGRSGRTGTAYLTVIGMGVAEGAVMLALPALLAPVLAAAGAQQAASAALVVYAAGVLGSTLVLRRHARRWGPVKLLTAGGSLGCAGAVLVAVTPSVAVVLLCAAVLGVAWGYLHTTLQTWLPHLVPAAERARAASSFAAAAMLANSVVVAASTSALQSGHHAPVFAAGAVLCALLTGWAVSTARHWR
ncbi:MFS transporter [Streptomyces lancefieldiae]|uniref:MFS transporter n=1 Tax=Streptomyces lancefieldiae TaxID=3075520 RepID=A0ABU3AZW2_9ACTN|nr:MFS transporter [Streptomyces sp. DSM 40712]MDT0615365.1 MFS transporter [Streptomyces sp. DSM 40712]